MIPKILHFARFGPQPVSELNRRCMDSWKAVLPDWQFMFWGDSDVLDKPWLATALKVQPANVSIWMRLHALHKFGGVYVDNDAELVRVPDLQYPCFFGFQRDDVDVECVNDGAMGSEPEHPFIAKRMEDILKMPPNTQPSALGPKLLTEELRSSGLTGVNVEQDLPNGVHVYTKDVLYPFRWDQRPDHAALTDRTISIHWWEGSWLNHHFPQSTGHFE